MSEEAVEVVRRAWEAWERDDMKALFALYDPAIIWDQTHYGDLISDVYHGHDGVRQFFRRWLDPFETYWAHAETFIDAGDKVVVEVRQGGRGETSSVDVEMPVYWQVYTVRDGLIVRVEPYRLKAEALEAAGLSKDVPASEGSEHAR
jgi:ketosteroid isomerase-like protein